MEDNLIMRKKTHIFIVTILAIAIIGVYFIGEKKLHSENKKSSVTSAEKIKVDTTGVAHTPVNKLVVAEKNIEDTPGYKNENRRRIALIMKNKTTDKDSIIQYNDKPIPILMYHSIAYEKDNDIRIPKEKFREQMKFLKDNGYTTLTLTEVSDLFTKNIPIPKKSVVLTFDDGYVDNYTNAFPVLKEFGIKATVFVITDWVDKVPQFMTISQLKEMEKNGIDIEAHTQIHDELDKLNYDEQLKTLKGSKEFLEKNLNKRVNFMAYPFGKYNSTTIKAANDAGYTVALKMAGGWAKKENGMLTLNRIYVGANDSIDTFKNKISIPTYK
jgi:peptidoglycan/xylan/chitin deacetylase (PgdA/CDA1 family)